MLQSIRFTKMHGLGNDFVVVDARTLVVEDWQSLARAMCDRHLGIGADQLLLVCESSRADVKMRLFNVDGFEAEMCGNGIRCVGKFVYENHIVRRSDLCIETLGGIKHLQLHSDGETVTGASVAMGVPRILFADEYVNFVATHASPLCVTGVDMGNPHAVAFMDESVDAFPLAQVGPLVENHSRFPNRTNIEIVNVLSSCALRVRVWERSVGITLACGTGACAATAAARLKGCVGDDVAVHLPGGMLHIQWDGVGEMVMTGPATRVFDGDYLVVVRP